MTTKADGDFKVDLSDVIKIPAKELEKHFRDWMESNDVARALQAKLRADLIANFNKTTLGKQILCHTTTTTGGATTQRLTLSPLVLAVNTLVAEFLYAQNCHFSLSVFCTEVPFRNTLPEFESMRHFRFSAMEIADIMQAICGIHKYDSLEKEVTKSYTQSTNVSLLFYVLKTLLQPEMKQATTTRTKATLTSLSEPAESETKPNLKHVDVQCDAKADVNENNFRYLNKYLLILSKKVTEMAMRFESLQVEGVGNSRIASRPRLLKSLRRRKYENLNRSLERITESLKQMTKAKRKSKQINAILAAIDGLGVQFSKCSTSFENMQKNVNCLCTLGGQHTPLKAQSAAPQANEKQTETEAITKTYADWVHEMRTTQSGQKFLDRVEIALRKALNKQKEQLNIETELKLRHQKETLKMRFKQKFLEYVSKHTMEEKPKEAEQTLYMSEQLQRFEAKQIELLQKLQEVHEKPKPVISPATTEIEANAASPLAKIQKPIIKDVFNTQKQLQEIVKNIATQERTVDHIVYDAKRRIEELENEGNELEKNFHNYLERQRQQKEATNEAAKKLWDYYNREHEKMQERYRPNQSRQTQQTRQSCVVSRTQSNEEVGDEFKEFQQQQEKQPLNRVINSMPEKPNDMHIKNAILEAKEKFFRDEQRMKQHIEHEYAQHSEELSLLNLSELLNSTNNLSADTAMPTQDENQQQHALTAALLTQNLGLTLLVGENDAVEDGSVEQQQLYQATTTTTHMFKSFEGNANRDIKDNTSDSSHAGNANAQPMHLQIGINGNRQQNNAKHHQNMSTVTSTPTKTSALLHNSMKKMQQLFAPIETLTVTRGGNTVAAVGAGGDDKNNNGGNANVQLSQLNVENVAAPKNANSNTTLKTTITASDDGLELLDLRNIESISSSTSDSSDNTNGESVDVLQEKEEQDLLRQINDLRTDDKGLSREPALEEAAVNEDNREMHKLNVTGKPVIGTASSELESESVSEMSSPTASSLQLSVGGGRKNDSGSDFW